MAGNSLDSLCKIYQVDDVLPKLIGITAVNMTASVLKDRAFAEMFGTTVGAPVGRISLLIWLVRDFLTVANAFILPDRIAHFVHNQGLVEDEKAAKKMATFICPTLSQFALTPLHLLGFDFYNRPSAPNIADRIKHLTPKYLPSVGIRMVRMGAAYGIGGVNNRSFREFFIGMIEGQNWDKSYKLKAE